MAAKTTLLPKFCHITSTLVIVLVLSLAAFSGCIAADASTRCLNALRQSDGAEPRTSAGIWSCCGPALPKSICSTLSDHNLSTVAVVGTGSSGIILEAEDTTVHKSVAVKLLPMVARTSFKREVRIMRKLAHSTPSPRIIDAFFVDADADPSYFTNEYAGVMVMELFRGGNLQQRIEELDESGRLNEGNLAALAARAFESLAALHNQGCIHGDVKADNFMMRGDEVVLVDFGRTSCAAVKQASKASGSRLRDRCRSHSKEFDMNSLAVAIQALLEHIPRTRFRERTHAAQAIFRIAESCKLKKGGSIIRRAEEAADLLYNCARDYFGEHRDSSGVAEVSLSAST